MGSLLSQINEMEAGLGRLQAHEPGLPVSQILTSRLLVHLGRELSALVDQRLRPHGLTDIEFRTLMVVHSHRDSGTYPGELCTSLGNSPANITRITDLLVERGLLNRLPDEQDRRRLTLRLSDRGVSLVQRLMPVMLASVQDSYRQFTPQDVEQLLGCLKKLAIALDKIAELQSAPVNEPTHGIDQKESIA